MERQSKSYHCDHTHKNIIGAIIMVYTKRLVDALNLAVVLIALVFIPHVVHTKVSREGTHNHETECNTSYFYSSLDS